jgi:hypothetical protein
MKGNMLPTPADADGLAVVVAKFSADPTRGGTRGGHRSTWTHRM